MKKIMIYLAGLVVVLTLIGCTPGRATVPETIQQPVSSDVVAEGHILPKDDMHLAFQVPGRVNQISVKEGDTIRKGQILASLGDRAGAEQALSAARLELETAQQDYDRIIRTAKLINAQAWTAFLKAQQTRAKAEEEWEKLDLDQIEDDIEDAESDVKDYQADLKEAQEDFDKYKDLDEDSSKRKEAKDDLETAQEDYNESVRKLEEIIQKRDLKRAALDDAIHAQEEAKRTYENSLNQPDKDSFNLADRRLEQAKTRVSQAEEQLTYYDLTAPFDGIVTDVNVSLGEWVTPSTWAIGVADTSKWFVETNDLSELDVVGIQTGQQVQITADAIPEKVYTGIVENIGLEPVDQGGDIYYTIRILVTDPDTVLKWGMTVEVKFPGADSTE
jgi:multidrug resistance efflux pump